MDPIHDQDSQVEEEIVEDCLVVAVNSEDLLVVTAKDNGHEDFVLLLCPTEICLLHILGDFVRQIFCSLHRQIGYQDAAEENTQTIANNQGDVDANQLGCLQLQLCLGTGNPPHR